MELQKDIITCLMKDDASNLLLSYRKFVSINCDLIGIQTAYDRKNQRFIITQELTQHFDKLACIGPVPIYEDYVKMANFPYDINLDDYMDNIINTDIVTHLKNRHIDDIYPKQKTIYHPKLKVNQELFTSTAKSIDHKTLNIVINIFDPIYDADFNLIYDVIFCINWLQKKFELPLTIYIAGIVHDDFVERVYTAVEDEFRFMNDTKLINVCGSSLSEQISCVLHSDLTLSGSYGLGFLAYMIRATSCVIFPYNLENLIGKTIDKTRNTDSWYLETTDDDLISNLDSIFGITRRMYDRNRNSNI